MGAMRAAYELPRHRVCFGFPLVRVQSQRIQLERIMFKKRLTMVLVLVLFCVVTAVVVVLPSSIDQKLNKVSGGSIVISERARNLHKSLFIVDLHADSLLWDRDLLVKNSSGHVDIPRLIDGHVALQAFTIVTKVPRKLRAINGNIDNITLLSLAEHWPWNTWSSLSERALYQTDKLRGFAARSDGRFTIIKSAADLDAYIKRRTVDSACTAGFLGIEGAHALAGDLHNIDLFFDHGVRMMSPTHFFDNDIGGSSNGAVGGGLTKKGKEMIREMQAKPMIVDLAHASSATIKDVLAISVKPVIVSHTGVKGTCDNSRNLSDSEIVGIAKTGGVIGIGYWPEAVCGQDAPAIARAIRYAANLAGVEHVALGSDFDGACSAPFDATGIIAVTQALIAERFTDDEIRLIMGGNALRVIRAGLPRN